MSQITDNHEHFEVLIEKRLVAAESADEARELDTHLAECPSCRELMSDSERDHTAMTTSTQAFTTGFDWDKFGRSLENRMRIVSFYKKVVVAGVLVIAATAVLTAPAGERWESVLAAALGAALVLGPLAWLVRRSRQRILALGDADVADQEVAYRDHVASTSRHLRVVRVAMVLVYALLTFACFHVSGWLAVSLAAWLAVMAPIFYKVLFTRWGRDSIEAFRRGDAGQND